MANQYYGYPGSGPTQYPPNAQVGNAPYPTADNPPPYPSNTNPPYNPSYIPSDDKSFATAPLISQNTPQYPPPVNVPQHPPPLNAAYSPYQNPPAQGFAAVPQYPPNIAAINSVPVRNTYWGTNYGPGWYRYSPGARKKILIIFGVVAGLMMIIFIIVFVTLTVKSQQQHDAFIQKHFGN